MMEHDGRELVTINRACELAGICRRTIYTWIAEGKVETIRTASGTIRVYADTLYKKGQDA